MLSFFKRLLTRREQPATLTRRWFADLGNIERLRVILADPAFITASNIVLTEAALTGPAVMRAGDSLPVVAAYNAGINDFLVRLEQLSAAPLRQEMPDEWGHIEDETTLNYE
jgi:hypothetical protein